MILVSTARALHDLAIELGGVSAIGVDTEGDSFYSYREKTCLVQISTRDEDYVIDPLALSDLTPLASVFADVAVLKVFHAAENDIAALRRDLHLETRHLFDTRVAARILGVPRVGLADLLREHFGVETNKRLQRYPWASRPLDRAALEYAARDSHYLLPLRDLLWQRLADAGRLDEAEEEFERGESAAATERTFDPETFWRLKGASALTPPQRAVLRELYSWRDRQAAAADRPPFRIAPDSALVALAKEPPANLEALRRAPGVPAGVYQRYAYGILAAIRRGAAADVPRPPRVERRDDTVVARYEALRAWRRQIAAKRGVEPDVIVSNASLLALATQAPAGERELEALGVLGPWRLRAYGTDLLRVLHESRTDAAGR